MESCGHDDDQLPHAENNTVTDGGIFHRCEMASNIFRSN